MKYKEFIKNNKLREVRKSLGLRQTDVAKILKLDIADGISHWENGKAMPSIISLFRLCEVYGVKVRDLYPDLQ